MSKKKICFISLSNLYLCPYIKRYVEIIEKSDENYEFDIIYWDRHNLNEIYDGANKSISFQYILSEGSSYKEKVLGYLKFKKFTQKKIQENKYNGIVLLQTSAGVLLQKSLKKLYFKKYILDIRDYTMENNKLFYYLISKLIDNSFLTVISSEGYKNFLPEYKYLITHNSNEIEEKVLSKFDKRNRTTEKIVISYIGLIRFHEQNKKVIMNFLNDNRFTLRFIGEDAMSLKSFCDENNVKNVELIDRFPPEKTIDYYYDTDIIYNLYGNNTPLLDYSLSNKLYYAAQLNIPILVCPKTFMEEVSTKYNFGLVYNDENLRANDDLFEAFNNLDREHLKAGTKMFLKKVKKENELFSQEVRFFLNNI
ncbi:glycosyltransferase family protein [Planococcus plakortidis]|uniref:capsular biosynthesis protein n=1 Tax=Planococcus plakortidis TaxID=1038856 RepID=UPI00385C9E8C